MLRYNDLVSELDDQQLSSRPTISEDTKQPDLPR